MPLLELLEVRDVRIIKDIAGLLFTNDNLEVYPFDSLDRMYKDVARTFHFPPSELSLLYLDKLDIHGLFFWYEDAVEKDQEVKSAIEKAKKKK